MMFDDNELVTDDSSVFQDKRFVDAIFKRADESIERQKSMKDVMECIHGDSVRYVGASDGQVNWGNADDPRLVLEVGHIYLIDEVEVYPWHSEVKLIGIKGWFNSVCFNVRP